MKFNSIVQASLLALLVSVSTAAFAAPPSAAKSKLMQPAVLRGEFQQRRHLSGFKHALASSGEFVLARGKGVIWNTRQPYASVTVITADRLSTRDAESTIAKEIPVKDSPAAGMVGSLLMALISGDVATLSRVFKVEQVSLPGGIWRMELVPKQAGLARIFLKIQLDGDRYVRSVHLHEKTGDVTDIDFSGLSESPAQLDAAELKQIE